MIEDWCEGKNVVKDKRFLTHENKKKKYAGKKVQCKNTTILYIFFDSLKLQMNWEKEKEWTEVFFSVSCFAS